MSNEVLTPSEQRTRETLASRLYAAAALWEAAAAARDQAQAVEREARAEGGLRHELATHDAKFSAKMAEQAWREYEAALDLSAEFRMRPCACSRGAK